MPTSTAVPPVASAAQRPAKVSKHTAVYVRVSSKKQDHASQVPDLRGWLDANPGSPAVWYEDTFTGKTMDRPGWRALDAALRAGRVDRLVVWRLDRLGRTAVELIGLFRDLRKANVDLITAVDKVSLADPNGRFMAGVIALMAEYDNEIRGERVRAGQAVAKAKGKHLGRKPGPGKRLKVNDEHLAEVPRLKAEGLGVSAIARLTGLSRPTVYAILGGPVA